MKAIVERDNPVLRKKAEAVAIPDIKSARIQKIIADMKESLASQDDGVALAAPQIGESLRIFVVAPRIIDVLEETKKAPKGDLNLVYINPEIKKISRDRKFMEEGCLSIRHWYGKIKRASRATISAYDENGVPFERGGSGILAQIFQHETDHLNGILFVDNAKDLVDMPPTTPNPRRDALKKIKETENNGK